MALLGLILVFMLHFEAGINGEHINVYYRPGDDAVLTCGRAASSGPSCSIILWLYNRDASETLSEIRNGRVQRSSARAERLSLNADCSLVVNNITAEDAGRYTCREGDRTDVDERIYLNVLTISPSPPDADPKTDGQVILQCSLFRYTGLGPCKLNRIRWVDEAGTELLGEGVGYEVFTQANCVSLLLVKHQSGHNRKYTCQFVDQSKVEIEADYTPDFTDVQTEKSNSDSADRSPLSYVMLTLRVAGLMLMIGITVAVIRHRGNTKPLGNNVQKDVDEVDYENVEARSAATGLH